MTLQQLKYVVTVAETGTITNAAKKLSACLMIMQKLTVRCSSV